MRDDHHHSLLLSIRFRNVGNLETCASGLVRKWNCNVEFIHISRLFRSKISLQFDHFPFIFNLILSFFFRRKENSLSLSKIPPDILLYSIRKSWLVLYIIACQFLTLDDRSSLKLNFPPNLLLWERKCYSFAIALIISFNFYEEEEEENFLFPYYRLSIKLARKEKKSNETRTRGCYRKERKIACSWWFESESEEYLRDIQFSSPPPAKRINFCRPAARFLTSRLE